MTTTERPRVRTTRLRISEVIPAWADATLETASSHIAGKDNWYHSQYWASTPDEPSLVVHGNVIISQGTELGYRFEKDTYKGLNAQQDIMPVEHRYWYLLNSDGFTRWGAHAQSDHQSAIRAAVREREHYLIPFSALRMADLTIEKLEFIDKRPDQVVKVRANVCHDCGATDTGESMVCTARGHYENYTVPVVIDGETMLDQGMCKCGESVLRHGNSAEALKHPFEAAPATRTERRWVEDDGPHEFVRDQHVMGATLFRMEDSYLKYDDSRRYRDATNVEVYRYFISAIDETGTNPMTAYFLTELDTRDGFTPGSLEEAYNSMMPPTVKLAETYGVEVRRQGEWFFIRIEAPELIEALATEESRLEKGQRKYGASVQSPGNEQNLYQFKQVLLPNPENETTWSGRPLRRQARHQAFRLIRLGGKLYVRGNVTHIANDHRPINLNTEWWEACHNVQIQSWSLGSGAKRANVD